MSEYEYSGDSNEDFEDDYSLELSSDDAFDKDDIVSSTSDFNGEQSVNNSYSFPVSTTANGNCTHRMIYSKISFNSMQKEIYGKCERLGRTLNLDSGQSLSLLINYQWKEEKLLEDYMNCDSNDNFLRKKGIYPTKLPADLTSLLYEETDPEVICTICYCGPEVDNPLSMFKLYSCSHSFCADCYTKYIETRINTNLLIKCPYSNENCDYIITVSELEVLDKYYKSKNIESEKNEATEEPNFESKLNNFFYETEDKIEVNENGEISSDDDSSVERNKILDDIYDYQISLNQKEINSDIEKRNKSLVLKYWYNSTKSYCISNNKKLKYCPFPDCNTIVELIGFDSNIILNLNDFINHLMIPNVQCNNKHEFCFNCLDEAHAPCPCELVKKWQALGQNERLTFKWIETNTKKCPNCNSAIEKNGGCHHMQCRTCNYQFCWECMENWNTHGYNRPCSNYTYTLDKNLSLEAQLLNKYNFYYEQFAIQRIRYKTDELRIKSFEQEIKQFQMSGSVSWIESTFYKECISTLLECRNSLKWSYVFLYYITYCKGKKIVELGQWQLSNKIEELSKLFEDTKSNEIMRKKNKFLSAKSSMLVNKEKLMEICIDIFADPENFEGYHSICQLIDPSKANVEKREQKRLLAAFYKN